MARRSQKKRGARPQQLAAGATFSSDSVQAKLSWRTWLPQSLVIAAVTLWIYWPALTGAFLWDDTWYITDNPLLRSTVGLWKYWTQPGVWIEYYPIEQTTQWVQWHLWGDNPVGYHLMNVALHVISALLVWRLFSKLGLRWAWLGGLIFAVHPAQAESVAWITELKNTLSLPFFLGAMCCWVDYEEDQRRGDYLGALALFALAMLCKTTMAPFPLVILLYAWWKRGRVGLVDLRNSAPFFFVSLVMGCVTLYVAQRYVALGHGQPDIIPLGGIFSRLARAGTILAFYFARTFAPIDYSPTYPQWTTDPGSVVTYLPSVIAGLGLGWLWWKRKDWGRHALLGLGFFILFLSPFLGFVPGSYQDFTWVMDHFLYLPMIGLIGLVLAGAGDFTVKYPARSTLVTAGLTIAIAFMALESHAFANLFINDQTLWTYALQRYPGNWLAHNNLSDDLIRQGHFQEAMAHGKEVLRLRPDYSDGHYNMGIILEKTGDADGARDQYRQALELNPRDAKIRVNLASTYVATGDRAGAIAEYRQAIAAAPEFAQLRYNLGSLLLQSGDTAGAIEQLKVAVQLDPALAQAHENLGSALAQSGRVSEAVREFEMAIELDSGYVIARNNLGLALSQTGRIPEAIEQFKQVLQIDPENAQAKASLAKLQLSSLQLVTPAK